MSEISLDEARRLPRRTGADRKPTLSKTVMDGLGLLASMVEVAEGDAAKFLGFTPDDEYRERFENAIVAADWVRRMALHKSRRAGKP